MSVFIIREDYSSNIQMYRLDSLTGFNDIKLGEVEKTAIGYMKGYLNPRYDVDADFAKTGTDRDPVLLSCAIDITIYHLCKALKLREIPGTIRDSYNDWKEWLLGVQSGAINPTNLTLNETTGSFIIYGSNPKRENHI